MNLTISLIRRKTLHPAGALPRRTLINTRALQLSDLATQAVTDFNQEYPVTVDEHRKIDAALDDMIRMGVRTLLVVRDGSVVGLITSYDIQGERPLQYLQSTNLHRHDVIRVSDIMTPWCDLTTLDWQAVEAARVEDLAEFFQHHYGLTHVLVVEHPETSVSIVRGLISRTRLERGLKASASFS